MGKRQPRPEPFSLAELEEIAQSPALQGFDKVLQYRPVLVPPAPPTVEGTPAATVVEDLSSTVEGTLSSTVEAEPAYTVEDRLSSTVAARASFPGADLWLAEGAGGVFTSKRVKRIERAQDTLTHVEEAVYDALWRSSKKEQDGFRLAQLGYAELARASRVSKRAIQSVVDRLIEKRVIAIETPADISRRQSTIYRVAGYGAILKFLRDTDRHYVVRTGRGVFYARRMNPSTVEAESSSTVAVSSSSTVEARSPSTVESSAPSTVEAGSTVTSLDNKPEDITSSDSASVAARVVKLLPVDDDAVRRLIGNCRRTDPAATDDEIGYAAELWIRQNARNTSIRKPVAVMLTAVPKFFEAPATEIGRYRQQRAREAEQSRELARAILSDPDAPDSHRHWARSLIRDPLSGDAEEEPK